MSKIKVLHTVEDEKGTVNWGVISVVMEYICPNCAHNHYETYNKELPKLTPEPIYCFTKCNNCDEEFITFYSMEVGPCLGQK